MGRMGPLSRPPRSGDVIFYGVSTKGRRKESKGIAKVSKNHRSTTASSHPDPSSWATNSNTKLALASTASGVLPMSSSLLIKCV
jgi:hypothetical protein